jgi:hypothetical protein
MVGRKEIIKKAPNESLLMKSSGNYRSFNRFTPFWGFINGLRISNLVALLTKDLMEA